MVHKKSEYELKFHRLTNDIRAKIWKENVTFRETQKRMNLSDHYWRYQLIDDPCDCDEVSGRNSGVKSSRDMLVLSEADKHMVLFEDKAVQTIDCRNTNKEILNLEEEKVNVTEEKRSSHAMKEPEVTVESIATKEVPSLQDCATFTNDSVSKKQNRILNEERFSPNEGHPPYLFRDRANLSSTGTPLKNFAQSHLNPSPTRNAFRSYHPEQRASSVFAAFGWNDSDRDVGDRKTYNVRAPLDQVHHSALLASGKRLKELELHLAEQLRKKQQQKSQISIGPVNLSSIWMTEYQESFSRGQREPLARSVIRRPIVWRYT